MERSRSCTLWIIVLVLGCTLTIHIQLFAIFYSEKDFNEDDFYCESNIRITFSNDTALMPKTEEVLMNEWISRVGTRNGRIMSNKRTMKNYLSVGVAVLGASDLNDGNSVIPVVRTLENLVNKTSVYEKLHNVVIVILSKQFPEEKKTLLLREILKRFLYEINIGFIHIFEPSDAFDGNKLIPSSLCHVIRQDFETFQVHGVNGTDDDETWHKKLCIHLDLMLSVWTYAAKISENYLHIDENIVAMSNFIEVIRHFVRNQNQHSRNWGFLEFSEEDFVGQMMRSRDIIKFVYFFSTVQMLNSSRDEIYDLYLRLISQQSRLIRMPTVFLRVNKNDAIYENDEEDDEKRWISDDPQGLILTNMNHVGKHIPKFVYSSHSGYFQALMPNVGDWLTIVFDDEISVQRVKIKTGLKSIEIRKRRELSLLRGMVEVSPKVLKLDASQNAVTCADFVKIGEVVNGLLEIDNVLKTVWHRKTHCLRLLITEADGRDVIFQQIAVYV